MDTKGFTLIEMLIYVAIIGAVISTLVLFSFSISSARNQTIVVQEVQANSRDVLNLIKQKIQSSTGVNLGSSTFGSDPGVLSLAMSDVSKNPTIINLNTDNGSLQITEGAGSPVVVTSSSVSVTNLVFTNLTPSGERANIHVDLTIANKNDVQGQEFIFSQSTQMAVSIRQ